MLPRVEWGSGPVRFEMYSNDPEVVREAEAVFHKWRPDQEAQLAGSWNVSRRDDEYVVDPWEIRDGPPRSRVTNVGRAVTIVEYLAVGAIAEKCDHVLAFHAALLAKSGKSIAFVGPSHAGKSTLATGLWRRGWKFQSDDMAMSVGRKAVAAPRRVSLRSESRDHVGQDLWDAMPSTKGYCQTPEGFLFQPMHVDDSNPESFDLSTVFFLNRNGAGAEVQRLAPVDAAFALLPYTNLARIQRFPDAFKTVAALMSDVPAFDLPRAPLPQMIDTLQSIVDSL